MLTKRPHELYKNYKFKSLWLGILLLLLIAKSLRAQNFSSIPGHGIPALTNAKAEWLDFNNDDRLDLFISGTNGSGGLHTAVYLNNGNNTFNVVALTALTDLGYDFADYNKDGYVDIITMGVNSSAAKKTIVYRNDTGSGFTAIPTDLPNLSKGNVIWKDLDNDADADIILTGLNSSNTEQTSLFENIDGSYVSVAHSLPGLSNGDLAVLDGNHDDHPEVILTGINADGLPVTEIYSFYTDLSSSLYSAALRGSAFNNISIADYNEDGFEDVVIAGLEGETLDKKTSFYLNNSSNGFIDVTTSLHDVSSSSLDERDLDNDGKSDIILTGKNVIGENYFSYFQNTNGYAFNEIVNPLPKIYNGDAALADYDNDGDIDVFQIGNSDISFQSNLFQSDRSSTVSNTAPTTPATLEVDVSNDSVTFHWASSSDDLTEENSISYNIYISENVNGSELFLSPLSNFSNGFRQLPLVGNAGYKNFKSVSKLPEGRYYWSVQAIDNNHLASPFANEQSFAICYPVSLGPDTTICHKDVLSLTMGNEDDVVNWYSKTNGLLLANNNQFDYEILATDTIIVEVTRPYNCTAKDTIIVKMSSPLEIDLGSDKSICYGTPVTFTIPDTADSVNWRNPDGLLLENSFTYQYQVNVKDTIVAQVYNAYRCVSYDSVIVDVNQLPVFSLGNDVAVCYDEEQAFVVPGSWQQVNWHSTEEGILAFNTPMLNFQVLRKDTLIAQVVDFNGCINYDSLIVNMLPLPEISLGDDQDVCFEESATITLVGSGTTVNWYDASANLVATNANEYSFLVTADSNTIVEVTDDAGCVAYDTITVRKLNLPEFNIGADTSICFSSDILLETGPGFERVDWLSKVYGNIINANSWFFNYEVQETDTLIAEVLGANGCQNYDSIRIEMLPLPDFDLGEDKNICYQDNVALEVAGTWDEVNWYTEGDLILQPDKSTYEYQVEENLIIWAEVFDEHRCVNYDTIKVNTLALPLFNLDDEKQYCYQDGISLSVPSSENTTYRWTNSVGEILSTSNTFTSEAVESKKIFLTVTDDADCHFEDSTLLVVHPLPLFEVLGETTLCDNDTTMLTVDFANFQTIYWKDQLDDQVLSSTDTLALVLNQDRLVNVELTDVNHCTSIKPIVITVHDRPVVFTGEDILICFNESQTIGMPAVDGNKYQWTPINHLSDAQISSPVVTGRESAKYALTVTNSNNCSSIDSIYVEVNPEILVDAGPNTSICIGQSIQLGGDPTASGSQFQYTYEWLENDRSLNLISSNPTVKPELSTKYFVMVSSGKCSVEIDSVEITVNPLPVISIIGDQSIGSGSEVTLSATGGTGYRWEPSETLDDENSPSPVASPLKTTIYFVHVTDENHCTDTASVKVYVQNNLFIPNVFSPNGDGRNDYFKLFGSGIDHITLTIFDQKGNEVFKTSDKEFVLNSGWDGTYKGKPLKDDVYIWTVEGRFYNGDFITFEGKHSGVIKIMR